MIAAWLVGIVLAQTKNVECVVKGHGPYDETWESCLRLGADQARADCAISGKASIVAVEGREGSTVGRAECRARLAEKDECASACGSFKKSKGPRR